MPNQVDIVEDLITVTTVPDSPVDVVDIGMAGPLIGVPVFVQASAPPGSFAEYVWFKPVGSDFEIWVEDGS